MVKLLWCEFVKLNIYIWYELNYLVQPVHTQEGLLMFPLLFSPLKMFYFYSAVLPMKSFISYTYTLCHHSRSCIYSINAIFIFIWQILKLKMDSCGIILLNFAIMPCLFNVINTTSPERFMTLLNLKWANIWQLGNCNLKTYLLKWGDTSMTPFVLRKYWWQSSHDEHISIMGPLLQTAEINWD